MIVWWSRAPPYEAEVVSWLEATVEDVERLVGVLDSRDRGARRAATRVLERLRLSDPYVARLGQGKHSVPPGREGRSPSCPGPESVMPLIGALHATDTETREIAATLLGEVGDGRAVAPLVRALNDDLWFVRRAAATALGALGDARALPRLRARALGETVPSVRRACWAAFRRLEREASVPSTEVVPARSPQGQNTEPAPCFAAGFDPGDAEGRF